MLTEKQQKFLDVLFDEAQGDPHKAKKLAGYSDSTSTSSVTKQLKDQIFEKTKEFISAHGSKAAYSIYEIINNPTDLGNKEKMVAAKDILDRAGFKPTDKVDVKAEQPIFILPPKEE